MNCDHPIDYEAVIEEPAYVQHIDEMCKRLKFKVYEWGKKGKRLTTAEKLYLEGFIRGYIDGYKKGYLKTMQEVLGPEHASFAEIVYDEELAILEKAYEKLKAGESVELKPLIAIMYPHKQLD